MSIPSLTAMLQTSELLFTRVDQFSDQLEAALSLPTLRRVMAEMQQRAKEQGMDQIEGHPISDELTRDLIIQALRAITDQDRKETFANCWHANDTESIAMWELYSNRGVAIRSKVGLLQLSLEEPVMVCRVTYVDHASEEVDDVRPCCKLRVPTRARDTCFSIRVSGRRKRIGAFAHSGRVQPLGAH